MVPPYPSPRLLYMSCPQTPSYPSCLQNPYILLPPPPICFSQTPLHGLPPDPPLLPPRILLPDPPISCLQTLLHGLPPGRLVMWDTEVSSLHTQNSFPEQGISRGEGGGTGGWGGGFFRAGVTCPVDGETTLVFVQSPALVHLSFHSPRYPVQPGPWVGCWAPDHSQASTCHRQGDLASHDPAHTGTLLHPPNSHDPEIKQALSFAF